MPQWLARSGAPPAPPIAPATPAGTGPPPAAAAVAARACLAAVARVAASLRRTPLHHAGAPDLPGGPGEVNTIQRAVVKDVTAWSSAAVPHPYRQTVAELETHPAPHERHKHRQSSVTSYLGDLERVVPKRHAHFLARADVEVYCAPERAVVAAAATATAACVQRAERRRAAPPARLRRRGRRRRARRLGILRRRPTWLHLR